MAPRAGQPIFSSLQRFRRRKSRRRWNRVTNSGNGIRAVGTGSPVALPSSREPIGEDIIACGNPVIVNMLVDPPDVKFDDARMGAMMSRLAGVPISAIGKMDPQDFAAASWILAPFFLPMG